MKTRDALDDLDTGGTDFDDEDVAIMKDENGRASIVPRSLSRLPGPARAALRDIQETAQDILELQEQLDHQVLVARDEFGVSWNAIGWSIGTSGQNARKRWSDAEDPAP